MTSSIELILPPFCQLRMLGFTGNTDFRFWCALIRLFPICASFLIHFCQYRSTSHAYMVSMTPCLLSMTATVAARVSDAIADVVLLVLTWIKTFETHRTSSKAGVKAPLIRLIFVDGESFGHGILTAKHAEISLVQEPHTSGMSLVLVTFPRTDTQPCSVITFFQLSAIITLTLYQTSPSQTPVVSIAYYMFLYFEQVYACPHGISFPPLC